MSRQSMRHFRWKRVKRRTPPAKISRWHCAGAIAVVLLSSLAASVNGDVATLSPGSLASQCWGAIYDTVADADGDIQTGCTDYEAQYDIRQVGATEDGSYLYLMWEIVGQVGQPGGARFVFYATWDADDNRSTGGPQGTEYLACYAMKDGVVWSEWTGLFDCSSSIDSPTMLYPFSATDYCVNGGNLEVRVPKSQVVDYGVAPWFLMAVDVNHNTVGDPVCEDFAPPFYLADGGIVMPTPAPSPTPPPPTPTPAMTPTPPPPSPTPSPSAPTPTPAPTLPDLVLTDISWSPDPVPPYGSFTLRANVTNAGTAVSAYDQPSVCFYVAEKGTTIDYSPGSAHYMGVAALPNLGAGLSTTVALPEPLTWHPAELVVAAFVDSFDTVDEGANEGNNKLEEYLSVSAATPAPGPSPSPSPTPAPPPDLTVTGVSWSPDPVKAYHAISPTATVANSGGSASPEFYVNFYVGRSVADIDYSVTSINWVGHCRVDGLATGESAPASVNNTFSRGGGDWVLVAWVDAPEKVDESDEDNNRLAEDLIIQPPPADLTVIDLSLEVEEHEASPEYDVYVTPTATISNLSATDVDFMVDVGFYASKTGSVDYPPSRCSDWLGWGIVYDGLPAGKSADVTFGGRVLLNEGQWILAAWVDGSEYIDERDEGNNRLEIAITVAAPAPTPTPQLTPTPTPTPTPTAMPSPPPPVTPTPTPSATATATATPTCTQHWDGWQLEMPGGCNATVALGGSSLTLSLGIYAKAESECQGTQEKWKLSLGYILPGIPVPNWPTDLTAAGPMEQVNGEWEPAWSEADRVELTADAGFTCNVTLMGHDYVDGLVSVGWKLIMGKDYEGVYAYADPVFMVNLYAKFEEKVFHCTVVKIHLEGDIGYDGFVFIGALKKYVKLLGVTLVDDLDEPDKWEVIEW